jgi:NADH-quinone oxidoreductase subunit E
LKYVYFYNLKNLLNMRIERIRTKTPPAATDAVDLSLIDELIAKYKGKKGTMIPLLQGAQSIYGYIPSEVFEKIARDTGLSLSEMYGVATFYAQFRLHPVGKYIIKVCHGTACHVQNATRISEALEESLKVPDGGTTEDRLFTLESVACLGCCSLAPVMMIQDETYGKLTGAEAVRIVKNIRIKEQN